MLTVQDIQSHTFEKVMFNGYDMKSVDDMLEKIVEDYASLQKENVTLKAKMKVLVDKIDEYRSVEESIRRTLFSAQDIAKETIAKAKVEAEQITSAANMSYESRQQELKIQFSQEEERLEAAKRKNAEFAAKLTSVYEAQLKTLKKLTSCADLQPAETTAEDTSMQDTQPLAAVLNENVSDVAKPIQEQQPRSAEDGTAKFNFGELKFGSGYNPNKD